MKTLRVEVPTNYCNECIFFSVYDLFIRSYKCKFFDKPLQPDYKVLYRKGHFACDDEQVAYPCKECKEYK